jgi:hypothetical protein
MIVLWICSSCNRHICKFVVKWIMLVLCIIGHSALLLDFCAYPHTFISLCIYCHVHKYYNYFKKQRAQLFFYDQ